MKEGETPSAIRGGVNMREGKKPLNDDKKQILKSYPITTSNTRIKIIIIYNE